MMPAIASWYIMKRAMPAMADTNTLQKKAKVVLFANTARPITCFLKLTRVVSIYKKDKQKSLQ